MKDSERIPPAITAKKNDRNSGQGNRTGGWVRGGTTATTVAGVSFPISAGSIA
ncbi:MAG: hypothetical protein ABSE79_19615 [Terriglobia bacterium]